MLTYGPAKLEQYDELLQLMRDEASEYLEHSIELIQMTWQQFRQAFKTVGRVYGIAGILLCLRLGPDRPRQLQIHPKHYPIFWITLFVGGD